jgi:hypothetical protein
LDIWASENTAFAEKYTKAKKLGADAMIAYCMVIADDSYEKPDSRKVRIEARMKIAALWHPEKYSPKVLSGETGKNVQTLIHVPFSELSPEKKAELESEFGL